MNIKYSQKKQEMREDPVMEFFFKAKEYAIKNLNMLTGVGIAVVFAIGFMLIYAQMKKSSMQKAEDAFGQAMIEYNNNNIEKAVEDFRTIADSHRGTPHGIMSAYLLGSIFLRIGRFDDAIKWFEDAGSKKGPIEFIPGEANEGMAGCYEEKGDIPKALVYYQNALNDSRIIYRHTAIRWKMALLNQKINNDARAKALCQEILGDSTATNYRQQAENLLAVLDAAAG